MWSSSILIGYNNVVQRQHELCLARARKGARPYTDTSPSTCPISNDIQAPVKTVIDDDYGNDGVIFEKDNDEDYYMFSGQEWGEDVEVDIRNDEKADTKNSNIPDKYEFVYSNIPQKTQMLKSVENCSFCGAKKFQHESKGMCCRLLTDQTSPSRNTNGLMRLWTSNDSDARYF